MFYRHNQYKLYVNAIFPSITGNKDIGNSLCVIRGYNLQTIFQSCYLLLRYGVREIRTGTDNKIIRIMERKRSSGFLRIFTVPLDMLFEVR